MMQLMTETIACAGVRMAALVWQGNGLLLVGDQKKRLLWLPNEDTLANEGQQLESALGRFAPLCMGALPNGKCHEFGPLPDLCDRGQPEHTWQIVEANYQPVLPQSFGLRRALMTLAATYCHAWFVPVGRNALARATREALTRPHLGGANGNGNGHSWYQLTPLTLQILELIGLVSGA